MITTVLNRKNRDTKVLVFDILVQTSPLPITHIQTKLSSKYRRRISYQAVRKIVRKFCNDGVLLKSPNGYSINRSWLLQARRIIDHALHQQESEELVTEPISKLESDNYSTYRFKSLYDLDTFWGTLALDLTATWSGTKPRYYSVAHYAWWIVFNLGREIAFWQSIKERGFNPEIRLLRNLPLNKLALDTYKEIGIATHVRNKDGLDEHVLYNFIGDRTFRVILSPTCLKEIKGIFEKSNSLSSLSPKILHSLAHKRHDVELTVFNDSAITESLMRTYSIP